MRSRGNELNTEANGSACEYGFRLSAAENLVDIGFPSCGKWLALFTSATKYIQTHYVT
jgi:hypothetical protein